MPTGTLMPDMPQWRGADKEKYENLFPTCFFFVVVFLRRDKAESFLIEKDGRQRNSKILTEFPVWFVVVRISVSHNILSG